MITIILAGALVVLALIRALLFRQRRQLRWQLTQQAVERDRDRILQAIGYQPGQPITSPTPVKRQPHHHGSITAVLRQRLGRAQHRAALWATAATTALTAAAATTAVIIVEPWNQNGRGGTPTTPTSSTAPPVPGRDRTSEPQRQPDTRHPGSPPGYDRPGRYGYDRYAAAGTAGRPSPAPPDSPRTPTEGDPVTGSPPGRSASDGDSGPPGAQLPKRPLAPPGWCLVLNARPVLDIGVCL
ncbi:hypothetical protein ACFWPV_10250 [Streptomyces uncialis]|uniref:hypothetical protein n=1 Tax=Streptomyces uncialis TaxID=1048205 RepID=UPI003657F25F